MFENQGQRLNFGDLLRHARRAAGLTQEELAEQAGLSVRGISDLERGTRRTPRRDTMELLAHALHLTETERQEWRRARRRPSADASLADVSTRQPTTMVGREREFDLLCDATEHAISGRGQVVMLAGEPGIGKTRLAQDFSAYARSQDAWVLWGRSHEDEGAPAYWPWVQIVRAIADALAPDVLRRDLGRGASALAPLVPEVADKISGTAPTKSLSPEQARFELFESITRLMHSASLRVPLLIVLDDLQWADQSSLDLLSFLGQEIVGSRIVILGIYRDIELALSPQLVRTMTELSRTPHFQQVILFGLAENEVGQLITRVLSRALHSKTVSAVYERTEGNPFFVSELARLMFAIELPDGKGDDGAILTTVPPGVKGVLEQRFRRLSDNCYSTLQNASVGGREFDLSMLDGITSDTRHQLLDALDEALRARLIERMAGSVGRYRFSHALVRESLYESLGSAERASLHQQVGDFLERTHAGELGPHLSMLAHHFFEAIVTSDNTKAIYYAIEAGDRASSQYAHAEAANHYRQALGAFELGSLANSKLLCEVLLKLGEACNQDGQYQSAQQAFGRAATISRELHFPDCLARAALGAAGLGVIEHGERHHLQLLKDAVSILPEEPTALRSHVLARLSTVLQSPDLLKQRWALVDEAETIARAHDDASALLYALLARHRSLWAPRFRAERIAVALEFSSCVAQVSEQNSPPAFSYRMYDHLEAGEVPAVDSLIETFTTLVGELGQPQRIWIAKNFRAMRALMDGRFDEAEQFIEEARAIGEPAAPTLAVADHFMFRFFLHREQGRLADLTGPAHQIESWYPDDLFWQSLLTVLASSLGDGYTPLLHVDQLITEIERYGSTDGNAIAAAGLLATSSEIWRQPGHSERIYEILAPYSQVNAVLGNSRHFYCLGCVSHPLGLLASVLRRWDLAEQHFEDAIEMHRRMKATAYLAHSQYAYARMKAARDQMDDRAHAQELAGQVRESATALGMSVLARQSGALQAELGCN
jgi:transcriptional regulator with XRE-family HTH domain/tetratricopeptide (TPR) repeat protein